LEHELEELIRESLENISVSIVKVKTDLNFDDLKVVRIDVIYDQSIGSPSVCAMQRTIDDVWGYFGLDEVSPVVNFVALEDRPLAAAE